MNILKFNIMAKRKHYGKLTLLDNFNDLILVKEEKYPNLDNEKLIDFFSPRKKIKY